MYQNDFLVFVPSNKKVSVFTNNWFLTRFKEKQVLNNYQSILVILKNELSLNYQGPKWDRRGKLFERESDRSERQILLDEKPKLKVEF